MSSSVGAIIEPLIKRKVFSTEEEAVKELLRDYIYSFVIFIGVLARGIEDF